MNLSLAQEWCSTTAPASVPQALIRLRIVALASIAMCVMALGVAVFGLLPWMRVTEVTAYCVAGNIIFYWLLQTGRTTSLRDPSCIFAHHLFTISVLLLGCALIPQDRTASLKIFLLICAVDIPLLSWQQLTSAAAMAIAGVLVIVLIDDDVIGLGLGDSLLALCMALIYLPVLVAISRMVRKVRTRQVAQRAALADALNQLRNLSERDVLTGASNRRHALEVLAKEVARHERSGRTFSIGLLDLDFFKHVNDTHGHAAGDEVLIASVRVMSGALPATFTVVRWGGEEFLIVMPEMPLADGAGWMRQARSAIVFNDWSSCAPGLRIDASAGVSEHRLSERVEVTVERADRALYRAKAEGRGRVIEQSH